MPDPIRAPQLPAMCPFPAGEGLVLGIAELAPWGNLLTPYPGVESVITPLDLRVLSHRAFLWSSPAQATFPHPFCPADHGPTQGALGPIPYLDLIPLMEV